ncbi:hypothetical protein [Fulvivirga kasyanovii]|uniref:Nucleoid-associated protein n=1 Tax=Fulvivirga kasyanovii TaxID=396812 RepID=A0ABW9RWY2_9BACT|nr:hypothetical protein [Fulvivirga kasyanovii]MTI27525.1 hypothetical protein [Fulvivirga kasyanovii]
MDIFKKKEFLDLAEVQDAHCVSIYMPTHRVSTPDNIYKDHTSLKNRLKETIQQLSGFGLSDGEAKAYLKPAYDLLENEELWGRLSDGLAIFIYGDEFRFYTLPSAFDDYSFVSNHLYLKPLVEFLHGEGRHFIMNLSLGNVRFFEATRNTIVEVTMEGLIPQAIEEAVGTDYEQKSLQWRSGQGEKGDSPGMFHGHGSGNETEKKDEALKYFRAIDEGLMKMLHDEHAPLVIACVDYLFPIYKEANTYKHLQDQHIKGNHEHTDITLLKEKAWEIVKDQFDYERNEAEGKYQLQLSRGKAAFNVEEVIPAAIIGQAETLFIKRGDHVWGTYNKENNKVNIDDMHRTGNTDLLNKAAVETVRNGGEVYVLEEDDMPDGTTSANAVFRYQM